MPNPVVQVELTRTDLHLIGAALEIALAVAEGKSKDIESFESAVQKIEQSQDWNATVLKMRDATIRAMHCSTTMEVQGYA